MMIADSAPRWPPTLRPSQPTWTVSPPERNGSYRPHPPSSFIITQPKSWYSFYHPTEGGRLSRLRHCSKGVQPVPKAVYHSGCRDKQVPAVRFEPGSSHTAVRHVTARPLRHCKTMMMMMMMMINYWLLDWLTIYFHRGGAFDRIAQFAVLQSGYCKSWVNF